MIEAPLPWVRYWVPSGPGASTERWLDDHGWMRDQADEILRRSELDAGALEPRTLDELSNLPCLVLLGIAGAGKSTEVRRIAASPAPDGRGGKLLLECAVGTTTLFDQLRSTDEFRRWRRNEANLLLVLDGVDETPDGAIRLARTLRQELELARPALGRLSVRLTCRQTTWSRIAWVADSFRAFWGAEGVRILELAPLRFEDAVSGAQRWAPSGMRSPSDAERFLATSCDAGMSGFVRWPLSLRLLAASMEESTAHMKRTVIFEGGLTRLCVSGPERTPPVGGWRCSPSARLALAARVAAATLLGAKSGVWIQDDPPPHDALVAVEKLTGGQEPGAGGQAVQADRQGFDETFSECAVFRTSDLGAIRFEHDDFAAFLAARFLRARRVEPGAALDLLSPPGGPRGAVVAGLEPLAAWLGALVPEVAEAIAVEQPEVLLASPSPELPAAARVAAVDAVITGLEQGRIHPYEPWLERRGLPLDHPGLADQLGHALDGNSEAARLGAVRVGAALASPALLPALMARALDARESELVRVVAIGAAGGLGEADEQEQLRTLLRTPPAADPTGRIRGAVLAALWPGALPTTDLFQHLVPGAGETFLHELASGALEETLQPSELPVALRWAEGVLTEERRDISRGRVAEAVVRAALRDPTGSVLPDELRATVRRWILQGARPGRVWHGIWHRDWPPDSVRALIRTILEVGASNGLPNYIEDEQRGLVMALQHRLFLHGHLPWLLSEWLGASEEALKAWWLWSAREGILALIRQRWGGWGVESSEAGDGLWRQLVAAVEAEPELRAAVGDLLDPKHPSTASVRRESAQPADGPLVQDPAAVRASEARIRELLSPPEDPPGSAWPEVSWLLQTQPEGRSPTLAAATDLTERVLWQQADPALRRAIRDAASRWLEETPPRWEDWLATGRLPPLVTRAVWAFVLVGQESVDAAVWSAWAPVLLVAETPPVDEPVVVRLLEAGAEHASSELLAGMALLLSAESWLTHRAWRRLRRLLESEELRESAAVLVAERLEAGELTDVQEAFEMLLGARSPGARRTAVAALARENSTESSEAVAAALLLHQPRASWTELFLCLNDNPERGERVVDRVTRRFDLGGPRPERALDTEAIGQLLGWLIRRFPYGKDLRRGGAFTETPRTRAEDWRDALLRELKGRADADALRAVRLLHDEFGELEWLRRVAGEIGRRVEAEAWVPLKVDAVLKLGTSAPLRHERDLLHAVGQALNEIQAEMRAGDPPTADHLWDEGRTPRSPRRPKSESFLSDWLKRELRRARTLEGVSITRESETLPLGPGRKGQNLDLLLSKQVRGASGGLREISCLVEVKGAWHPDLVGGLRRQTAEYLQRSRRRTGLFLVVWFDPEQWQSSQENREERRRQSAVRQGPAVALAATLAEEVERLLESGLVVEARVLDASL